jgi:hypothetical protein
MRFRRQPTVITNPDELTATPPSSPFISFISAKTHTVLDKIVCDGQPGDGPNATSGIEQPVWDGARGKFYINIPSSSTTTNDDEVDEIDPVTMTITSPHSVSQRDRRSCPGPDPGTGADQQLRRSDRYCVRELIHQVTTTPPIFADEIWYNPGDERVCFGKLRQRAVVNGLPPQRDRNVALDRRVSEKVQSLSSCRQSSQQQLRAGQQYRCIRCLPTKRAVTPTIRLIRWPQPDFGPIGPVGPAMSPSQQPQLILHFCCSPNDPKSGGTAFVATHRDRRRYHT